MHMGSLITSHPLTHIDIARCVSHNARQVATAGQRTGHGKSPRQPAGVRVGFRSKMQEAKNGERARSRSVLASDFRVNNLRSVVRVIAARNLYTRGFAFFSFLLKNT